MTTRITAIATAFISLISCKAAPKKSGLTAIQVQGAADGDRGFFVLDESAYNRKELNTLTVRRLDCGGEDRYSKGSIEDLKRLCFEVGSVTLQELLDTHYIGAYWDRSGVNTLSEDQKSFLIYLIGSLRLYPVRSKPLLISHKALQNDAIDISKQSGIYKESYAKELQSLHTILSYDTRKALPYNQTISLNTQGASNGWVEQIVRLDGVDVKAGETLSVDCPVSLAAVQILPPTSRVAWTRLALEPGNIGADGYIKSYRVGSAGVQQSADMMRLLWRVHSTGSVNCSWSLAANAGTNTQTAEVEPQVSKAEKFRNASETFGHIGHRLHHLLWHSVRNAWNRPGTRDSERAQMARMIPGQDWTPPRPVHYMANGSIDMQATEQRSTGAGEDFLHMHREMLAIAKESLGNELDGMTSVDQVLAAREQMIQEGIAQRIPVRTQQEFQARVQGLKAREQELLGLNLRSITLAQLGTRIEWTLHNSLHESFARPVSEILLHGSNNPWSSRNFFGSTMPWNTGAYQHLGDPYAAATNPLFWLIHGYVDQWIDRWAKANGFQEVQDDCSGRSKCYQWLQAVKGRPWDGATGVDHASELQVSSLPDDLARSLIDMGSFITR